MVLITYNENSLRKHKITRYQVQEAMTDPLRAVFDLPEKSDWYLYELADEYNYHQMIVGHTYAGVLLEIGLEMIADNALHFFHAQKISPTYYKLYEHWLKNV